MKKLLWMSVPLVLLHCSDPLTPELPPLEVTGTVPAQQARNVPDTTEVGLQFNRAVSVTGAEAVFDPPLMYPALANNSIFTGRNSMSLSVNYHEHEHLLPGTTYTVTFTGIEDTAGGRLAPYNLIFVTQ